jgi:hypothetical protein
MVVVVDVVVAVVVVVVMVVAVIVVDVVVAVVAVMVVVVVIVVMLVLVVVAVVVVAVLVETVVVVVVVAVIVVVMQAVAVAVNPVHAASLEELSASCLQTSHLEASSCRSTTSKYLCGTGWQRECQALHRTECWHESKVQHLQRSQTGERHAILGTSHYKKEERVLEAFSVVMAEFRVGPETEMG